MGFEGLPWRIFENRPTEIEFESHFSINHSIYFIIQELSDYKKFLRIIPLKLNVRTISAVYPSIFIFLIAILGVTVLLHILLFF